MILEENFGNQGVSKMKDSLIKNNAGKNKPEN